MRTLFKSLLAVAWFLQAIIFIFLVRDKVSNGMGLILGGCWGGFSVECFQLYYNWRWKAQFNKALNKFCEDTGATIYTL